MIAKLNISKRKGKENHMKETKKREQKPDKTPSKWEIPTLPSSILSFNRVHRLLLIRNYQTHPQ